ncbi:glycoside hydrolase family 3 N-terminal domain-containing protein [uncultured Tessaracoccus sp.]|uniref:glycoside hydrolase family 3 N-terminal domain-containing protein n=1 Tax=uncultured Tessaracoccus sp. TaxID=905023 RepID=UPI0025E38B13|nr:glycoside hydrolase family 3 N-terminal domain-containing protein [uncultured Tessaracoccus sp.]
MARRGVGLALAAVLAVSACAPAPVLRSEPGQASPTPSASGSAEPSPSAPPAACLTEARALSPEARAGQLLMVGVDLQGLDSATSEAIEATKAGSVVLLGSGSSSRTDVAALSGQVGVLGTADLPILVAADQEGGKVQRLKGDGFTRIPSAVDQGQMNPTAFHANVETWARELAGAGVRFNLAPTADVVPEASASTNAPVGQLARQYGSDSAAVAKSVVTFVTGMQSADVATSLKHFPGLGRVTQNTDHAEATDRVTVADDPNWEPFKQGIAAGAESVMVSSATFEKIDPDHQAVFSERVITELLRGDLGFDGVVIADDLGAAEAVASVAPGDRAVQFVRAGGDLVINADPQLAKAMADAILKEMRADEAFAEQVTESVARVLALKQEVDLLECQ